MDVLWPILSLFLERVEYNFFEYNPSMLSPYHIPHQLLQLQMPFLWGCQYIPIPVGQQRLALNKAEGMDPYQSAYMLSPVVFLLRVSYQPKIFSPKASS